MNPLNFHNYIPFFLRRKFDEKIIIIESDDWGLERAMSNDSLEWMDKKFGKDKFSRWSHDALETGEDLNKLFDLLESFKGKFELPPVITANFITHNVDYSSPDELRFIPVSNGFNMGSEDVRSLYRAGIKEKYIFPQLHGFSHYNLSGLTEYFNSDEGKEAFRNKFFVARSTIRGNLTFLHGEFSKENSEAHKISEASEEFKNFFGFYSGSIIPPTFILDDNQIHFIKENNITLVQSSNRLTRSNKKRYRFPHFQKMRGLFWSVRNARLDIHPEYNFKHEQCMKSIETAFRYNSPAVIDFHRVNFAGKYKPEYRDETMKELKLLFNGIYKKWPEAKFIHTQKLNDILWQQDHI